MRHRSFRYQIPTLFIFHFFFAWLCLARRFPFPQTQTHTHTHTHTHTNERKQHFKKKLHRKGNLRQVILFWLHVTWNCNCIGFCKHCTVVVTVIVMLVENMFHKCKKHMQKKIQKKREKFATDFDWQHC